MIPNYCTAKRRKAHEPIDHAAMGFTELALFVSDPETQPQVAIAWRVCRHCGLVYATGVPPPQPPPLTEAPKRRRWWQ